MALPILLIVATSVSQIYDNKCAKMNHGLMIHDNCLFYNATSVEELFYSTEITMFRTSIVAAEIYISKYSLVYFSFYIMCRDLL